MEASSAAAKAAPLVMFLIARKAIAVTRKLTTFGIPTYIE